VQVRFGLAKDDRAGRIVLPAWETYLKKDILSNGAKKVWSSNEQTRGETKQISN